MNFWMIGNVNQYAKGLSMQTRWELKKRSGDVKGHSQSLQDYVALGKTRKQMEEAAENQRMSRILSKVDAGGKLSGEELEYLRVKNPAAYRSVIAAEEEQKAYEEALKRCKTRDEAQRLHVNKIADVLTAAKRGDSGALYRLNRLTETMNKFTASRDYKDLPTEADEAVARRREAEAEQAVRDAERAEAAAERAESEAEEADSAEPDGEAEAVPPDEATPAVEVENAKPDGAAPGAKNETVEPYGTEPDAVADAVPPDKAAPTVEALPTVRPDVQQAVEQARKAVNAADSAAVEPETRKSAVKRDVSIPAAKVSAPTAKPTAKPAQPSPARRAYPRAGVEPGRRKRSVDIHA